jgi:hypothetical protein
MAHRSGLSKSTIGRIWKTFELKPHQTDGFKLSNDPLFVEKVYDVIGLYLNPPEAAVVLCVDEKSQIPRSGSPRQSPPGVIPRPARDGHNLVQQARLHHPRRYPIRTRILRRNFCSGRH